MKKQRNLLVRSAGTARFVYNWGLDICRAYLGKNLFIRSAMEIHRMWNAYMREHAPWAYEMSKCAGKRALRDLRTAFDNFFASRSGKRQGPKMGFPRYQKRGRDDRFRLTGAIHAES